MTPEELSNSIRDLRADALFGEGSDGLAPMADAEYAAALAFLQLADLAATKAAYHQARKLAGQ